MEQPIVPTERDLENARIREEIAEKQQAEYDQCYLWALGAFGPGWFPSCRHYLVEKDDEEQARRTGDKPKAAATVYTVRNKAGDKRHFTVVDGRVRECAGYEEGFKEMLLESHPTMRIEVRGEKVAPHRFNLCWAGFEVYHPKSDEQLASLRVSREKDRKSVV